MEKYAVILDEEVTKIANKDGQPCPSCGSRRVDFTGSTPHCPNCGTQPWEKMNAPEDRRSRR